MQTKLLNPVHPTTVLKVRKVKIFKSYIQVKKIISDFFRFRPVTVCVSEYRNVQARFSQLNNLISTPDFCQNTPGIGDTRLGLGKPETVRG